MNCRTEVSVTSEQAHEYEYIAGQLLNDTLHEYDNHVTACINGTNPLHDKWQWKPLKRHEALNIFKERQPRHVELTPLASRLSISDVPTLEQSDRPTRAVMMAYAPDMALNSSEIVPGSSSVASLVVTGHITGNLSDIMYGLLATNSTELQLRMRYMADVDVCDTAMLNCIQAPNTAKPLNFMGLQRVTRSDSSRGKSSSRRPREFVFVVASGIIQHKPSGFTETQEIGYYLCQSVDLRDVTHQGLSRGWLSTCSLFLPDKESSTHTNVFSRGFVDFKEKMRDHQAVHLMSNMMLAGIVEAAVCGQSKKMSWLLNYQATSKLPESKVASNRCGICERKFGVLNSVAVCRLCHINMCSRCRLSRELRFVEEEESHRLQGEIKCQTVVLCKNCTIYSNRMDARDIARFNVESTINPPRFNLPESIVSTNHSRTDDSDQYTGISTTVRRQDENPQNSIGISPQVSEICGQSENNDDNLVTSSSFMKGTEKAKSSLSLTARTELESPFHSFASTLPSFGDRDSQEEWSLELIQSETRPQFQSKSAGNSASPRGSSDSLFQKMRELQMNAESVYQFTSRMNASIGRSHQSVLRDGSTSSISIVELD